VNISHLLSWRSLCLLDYSLSAITDFSKKFGKDFLVFKVIVLVMVIYLFYLLKRFTTKENPPIELPSMHIHESLNNSCMDGLLRVQRSSC